MTVEPDRLPFLVAAGVLLLVVAVWMARNPTDDWR